MIKVVDVDSKEMARELKRLSKNLNTHSKIESKRAVASVINKNLAQIKTKIVRRASTSTQIPQKAIRPRIKIDKAKPNNLDAKIWVGINRISAHKAGAKPSGSGFSVGPYNWANAFRPANVRPGQSNESGAIFERVGRAQFPIRKVMFGQEFVGTAMKNATNQMVSANLGKDFAAKLKRELEFRLDRIMKRT